MTMGFLSLVIFLVMVFLSVCETTYKLCCDPKCDTPISHGRTKSRKTIREEGHLTYPANAKLTIWAKHYNSQPEVWEAEMYGRWGLVNEKDIEESIVHCTVPQHWVPVNGDTSMKETEIFTEEITIPSSSFVSSDDYNPFTTTEQLKTTSDVIKHHDISKVTKTEISLITQPSPKPLESNLEKEIPFRDGTSDTDLFETTASNSDFLKSTDDSSKAELSHKPLPVEQLQDSSISLSQSDEKERSHIKGLPVMGLTQSELSKDVLASSFPSENEHQQKLLSSFEEPFTFREGHTSLENEKEYYSNAFNKNDFSKKIDYYTKEKTSQEEQDSQKPNDQMFPDEHLSPEIYSSEDKQQNDEKINSQSHNFSEKVNQPFQGDHTSQEHSSSHGDNISQKQDISSKDHIPEKQHFSAEEDHASQEHHSSQKQDLSSEDHNSEKQHFSAKEDHSSQERHSSQKQDLSSEDHIPEKQHFSAEEDHASQEHHSSQKQDLSSKDHISEKQHFSAEEDHSSQERHSSQRHDFSETIIHVSQAKHSFQQADSFVSHKGPSPSDVKPFSHVQHSTVNENHISVSQTLHPSEKHSHAFQDYVLTSKRESYSSQLQDQPSLENTWTLSAANSPENFPATASVLLSEKQSYSKLSSQIQSQKVFQSPEQSDSLSKNDVLHTENNQESQIVVDFVRKFFPLQAESWFYSKGIDASLFGFFSALIVVILPLFCSCCSIKRKANKINKELKSAQSNKLNMEAHIKKLGEEKNNLESLLKNLKTQLHDCQLKLENEKQGTWDLENIRMNLEREKKILEELYQSLQNDHNQDVKSLKRELQEANEQIGLLMRDKNSLQLQVATCEAQVKNAIQKCEESDAAKTQLEYDIYNVRKELGSLHEQHDKLSKEQVELTTEHSTVCSNLINIKEQLENASKAVADGKAEISILQECLQNLSGDDVEKSVQLEKIEAMLNTTKVQVELRSISSERDQLQLELHSQALLIDQLQTQNSSLQQELTDVYSAKENMLHQYQETQIKLKAITEYFEEKESHLHRRIGEEEIVRQRVESREAYAKERADLIEQEREKEREELKELRQQMGDIEKSLMQQVITNEKRAEDTLSQLRRTEQELRSANKEITFLKKQLNDIDDVKTISLDNRLPAYPSGPPPPRPSLIVPPGPRGLVRPFGPRGPPPPGVRLIGMPRPAFNSSSPVHASEKGIGKYKSQEDKEYVQSRPPPPGMESRDSYHLRPTYSVSDRLSPVNVGGKRGDQSFDRHNFHSDRPPVPGDLTYYPHRQYPPRSYHERRRPPSEPPYEEILHNTSRPPSNPPLGAGILFSSSMRAPTKYPRPTLPPSQSLPLNMSKENVQDPVQL